MATRLTRAEMAEANTAAALKEGPVTYAILRVLRQRIDGVSEPDFANYIREAQERLATPTKVEVVDGPTLVTQGVVAPAVVETIEEDAAERARRRLVGAA